MSEIENTPEEETPPPELEIVPETVPMSEIEDMAKENGWKPDGEKNAIEFMRASKSFRDRQHQTNKRQQEQLDHLVEENAKIYDLVGKNNFNQEKAAYNAQNESWEEKRTVAIEQGDVAAVNKLDETRPVEPQEPERVDPNVAYIQEWRENNDWFEDPQLNGIALGFFKSEEIRQQTTDPRKLLPKVEEMIKEAYPQKFKTDPGPNPNRELGAGVEGGTGKQSQSPASAGLQRKDLDEDESRHFQQLVDSGMDEKKLLASIEKARR